MMVGVSRGSHPRKKYHVLYLKPKTSYHKFFDTFTAKSLTELTEKIITRRKQRTPFLVFTDAEMFRARDRASTYHEIVRISSGYRIDPHSYLFTPKETKRAKERAKKIIEIRKRRK